MGLIESIAGHLGIGQPEIKKVFKGAIELVDRRDPILTKDQRDGIAKGFAAMLDQLRHEDAITKDTHTELINHLTQWHAGGTAQKQPQT